MTIIKLFTNDQRLGIEAGPKVASGNKKSVSLQVKLSEHWGPYINSAIFFTDLDSKPIKMLLVDGKCLVPHEVLKESGIMYIGIYGVGPDEEAKTSTLIQYRVEEGAPVGEGTSVEPTPDVYQQILAQLAKIPTDAIRYSKQELTEEQKRQARENIGAAAPGQVEPGGGNVDLTGYATEQWVQDQNYLTEVPEGYAKNEDIPKKPEDIGAQPSGDYALRSEIPAVPVQSVNGKTGPVQLSAADVGARSDNWMPTANQVGADPVGAASSAVSQHNVARNSHADIRLELEAINARLTAFFDSDDQTLDELSEIVAYITSNKTLIQAITTSKVSVTDIVDNLTTSLANKPLSAAQGVVLRVMIDTVNTKLSRYALKAEIPTKVSQLQNDSGYLSQHQDISGLLPRTELPTAIDTALAQAKESGEFDGPQGPQGKTGNGIKSAVLNADYTLTLTFDDGTTYTTPSIRGGAGQNGVSATHSWNGTVLTVTSASGTSSADLKGEKGDSVKGDPGSPGTSVTVTKVTESTEDGGSNVVVFSDGKTVTIKNGKKGADGKTPTRGVDYWTDADQEDIVQQVITALPVYNGEVV